MVVVIYIIKESCLQFFFKVVALTDGLRPHIYYSSNMGVYYTYI